jgi:uncharacterized repeat protein (TIGR03847 family)
MRPRRIRYPLGALASIDAEAFGQPGRRTFRLIMEAGPARSYVWLEKEQLFQLGVYLQEAIRSLSEEDRGRQSQPGDPGWSGQEASIEFKARQLLLNYDVPANSFYLQAHEADESDEEAASVSCWITPDQAQRLGEEALRICAAGRPSCFLCGLPINPEGHVCPRANGHAVLESG